MKSLLLESAGSGGKIGLINCLREEKNLKLIGTDCNPRSVCKSFFDDFLVTSKYKDPDFLPDLVDFCYKNECEYIYPVSTFSLDFFSSKKESFQEKGINLILSEENAIKTANNKALLYQKLSKLFHDHIPAFSIVNDKNSLEKAVCEFGYPQKKVCKIRAKHWGNRF